MKSFGLTMMGPFVLENVSELPLIESNNKGRLVFLITDHFVYVQTDTEWLRLDGGGGGEPGVDSKLVLVDTLPEPIVELYQDKMVFTYDTHTFYILPPGVTEWIELSFGGWFK